MTRSRGSGAHRQDLRRCIVLAFFSALLALVAGMSFDGAALAAPHIEDGNYTVSPEGDIPVTPGGRLDRAITLANQDPYSAQVPITIASIALRPAGGPFRVIDRGSCIGRTIPFGSSCTFIVRFTAPALPLDSYEAWHRVEVIVGHPEGGVVYEHNAVTLNEWVVIDGIWRWPREVDFGAVMVDRSAQEIPVTLLDPRAEYDPTLPGTGIRITRIAVPSGASTFSIDSGCGAPQTLISGCHVRVSAKPTKTGVIRGLLRFTTDRGVFDYPLRVEGVSSLLRITPSEWDFGDVEVGERSAPKRFLVENVSDDRVPVTRIWYPSGEDWDVDGLDACHIRDAHTSCEITITFTPKTTGRYIDAYLGVETPDPQVFARSDIFANGVTPGSGGGRVPEVSSLRIVPIAAPASASGAIPMRVTWRGDAGSTWTVWTRSTPDGVWRQVYDGPKTSRVLRLPQGWAQVRVRPTKGGRQGTPREGTVQASVADLAGPQSPDWKRRADAGSVGGTLLVGARKGARIVLDAPSARGYALVVRRTTAAGRIAILLDGKRVATVDVQGPSIQRRRVVWSVSRAVAAERRIEVRLLSGRVDLDAIIHTQ